MIRNSLSARFVRCLAGVWFSLWLVSVVHAAGSPESEAQTDFQNKIQTLAGAEQFDELDTLVADLRRTQARWPGGLPKLCTAYFLLRSLPIQRDDENCRLWIEKAERWVKAKPDSVTARIALAAAYASYGWLARGTGYASSITPENGKFFRDRLAKAREILTEAEKLPVKDPDLYASLLELSGSQAGWNPEVENNFKKAVAIDPSYYLVYFSKAKFLTPRWGGSPGAWEAFAREAAAMTEKEEGASLYARIVWAMVQTVSGGDMAWDDGFMARNNISWKKLKQGFEDLQTRYPGSDFNLDAYCFFACLAGDRETAHALFEKSKPQDWRFWGWDTKYESWQRWADPKISAPLHDCRLRLRLAPTDQVQSLAFSPDGETLAAGYGDTSIYAPEEGHIVFWDLATGQPRVTEMMKGVVHTVAFSHDGQTVACGIIDRAGKPGEGGDVVLRDAATGKIKLTLPYFDRPIFSLAYSPDGKMLAIASTTWWKGKGEVFIHRVPDKALITLPIQFDIEPRVLAFSPAGHRLAIGSWDEVVIEDTDAMDIDKRISIPHDICIWGMAFAPDGRTLITCSPPGQPGYGHINRWNVDRGKQEVTAFAGRYGWLWSLAISPNGKLVAAVGPDGNTCLWEVETGRLIGQLGAHWHELAAVAFSPDGKTLAAGGMDGVIELWDINAILAATQPISEKK